MVVTHMTNVPREQMMLSNFMEPTLKKNAEAKRSIDPAVVFEKTKRKPWRSGNLRKQNWGVWLHRMSAYVGKMKPAMAHCLIEASTTPGQTILDPFCGVGTIPLEADIMGRIGVGVDLNPYAAMISMAKFDRHPVERQLNWLRSVKIEPEKVDISSVSPFEKQYFHERTLREALALRDKILEDNEKFLFGCLLGILHGHRPGHLSVYTSLVVPFRPIDKPPYKEVIPRMMEKVKRMYRNPFPLDTFSTAFQGDARYLPLASGSIDAVVSSPPYYDTLDYIEDNRLRLEFMGYDEKEREKLNRILIQDPRTYLEEMKRVGLELMEFLKPGGICIYVLGDCHKGKLHVNTAQNVAQVYESIGFVNYGVIEDPMPSSPSFPTSYKRKKVDRILLMQKPK